MAKLDQSKETYCANAHKFKLPANSCKCGKPQHDHVHCPAFSPTNHICGESVDLDKDDYLE